MRRFFSKLRNMLRCDRGKLTRKSDSVQSTSASQSHRPIHPMWSIFTDPIPNSILPPQPTFALPLFFHWGFWGTFTSWQTFSGGEKDDVSTTRCVDIVFGSVGSGRYVPFVCE